jgi:ESS family glutamate:Na+ symporter
MFSDVYGPWTIFTDLGLIFGLLLVGKLIRVKIKVVQKLFIPPSLIAGILGLAFGPNGFDILPFSGHWEPIPQF